MIPPLKQHCHGIKDHHGKHNNIGQHEAGQHDKAEHTNLGRDLRRFCLESLELPLFEVMAEHLEIQTSVVAAQYADEPSRDIRKHGRSDSALEAHQRSLIGAWVGQITFEGKHYFDDKKLLVGKLRLIELIDETDEIEKAFHTVGGGGVPEVEEIHDTEVFQYWLQEILFELESLPDAKLPGFIFDTINILKKPFNGWNDKNDFIAIKGRLKAIRRNADKYYASNEKEELIMSAHESKKPKIFISHSSRDKDFVAQIVNLLDGIGLNQAQVFCSSLPGYGIPIDTNIFDFLRDQFLKYDLHVFFIHSSNYYESPVSLNEMGAAWALKSTCTSIFLPGFPFAGMKGVVNSEDVAIKLDNDETEVKDKLNQLHSKIVDEFNLTKKPDIIWESKRDAFIASIRSISPAIVYIPNNANSSIPLSNSAMALLKQAANEDGIILKVSDLSVGTQIQAGTTTMNKDVSDRERAKWEGALNELISAGFVERANANGDVFNLSNSGYKMVDKKH